MGNPVHYQHAQRRSVFVEITLITIVVICLMPRHVLNTPTFHAANWVKYTEKMTNDCMIHREITLVNFMDWFQYCVHQLSSLLGCGTESVDATSRNTSLESRYTMPCGHIHQEKQSVLTMQISWTITVFKLFHLQLAFDYFKLPMPIGQCNPDEAAELVLAVGSNSQKKKRTTKRAYLCGEIMPFHVVISGNSATVQHICVKPIPCSGSFYLRYQVHGRGYVQPATVVQPVTVIINREDVNPSSRNTSLSDKPCIFSRSVAGMLHQSTQLATYYIHLVADRLATMEIQTQIEQVDVSIWILTAFDGPGYSLKHIHPESQLLIMGGTIVSATFQICLHIVCPYHRCSSLTIHHKRRWTIAYHKAITITDYVPYILEYPNENCNLDGRPDVVWCTFALHNMKSNIRVNLQDTSLNGPKYFGDRENEERCSIAGVTIMDETRLRALADPNFMAEQSIVEVGDREVIDRMFPEITICGQVQYYSGDTQTDSRYDWPLQTFTSTYGSILVLFYAYSDYIDVDQFRPKLIVTTTHCVGFMTSGLPVTSVAGDVVIGESTGIPLYEARPEMDELLTVINFRDFKLLAIEMANLVGPAESPLMHFMYLSFKKDIHIAVNMPNEKAKCVTLMNFPHLAPKTGFKYKLVQGVRRWAGIQTHSLYADMPISPACSSQEQMFSSKLETFMANWTATNLPTGKSQVTGESQRIALTYEPFCLYYNIDMQTKACSTRVDLENVHITDLRIKQDIDRHSFADTFQSLCDNFTLAISQHAMYSASVTNYLYIVTLVSLYVNELSLLDSPYIGAELGQIHLMHILQNVDSSCPEVCRHYNVYVAYSETTTDHYIVVTWQVHLHDNLKLEVSQTGFVNWWLYITAPGEDTEHYCHKSPCQLHVNSQVTQSMDKEGKSPILGVSFNAKGVIPFAHYHYIWEMPVSRLSWTDAENECQKTGMHLASITSEYEYDIVKGLLQGQGYTKKSGLKEDWIATPCKVELAICLVHLGLRVSEVGTLHWMDSRPVGFSRWNEIYYKGSGPSSVKVTTTGSPFKDHDLQHLIVGARKHLQPRFGTGNNCTALIGSPGPHNMEFIMVPCDLKLNVSSVLCISGGNKSAKTNELVYSLHHWMHLSIWEAKRRFPKKEHALHFNIARYSRKFGQNFQLGDTGLSQDEYIRNGRMWPWKEMQYPCLPKPPKGYRTTSFVDFLCFYATEEKNVVSHLNKHVFVYPSNGRDGSPSVHSVQQMLTASYYCSNTWTLIADECVKPVKVQLGTNNATVTGLNVLCELYHSSASVLQARPTVASWAKKLQQWLQKWDLQNAAYINDTNVVLIYTTVPVANSHHVLCSIPTQGNTCPSGYYTCSNGECIQDTYMCDANVNCPSSRDEFNCNSTCVAPSWVDGEYCRYQCHPVNCTCNDLFFQCPSGGCLHSSKLCNEIVDCTDGADEGMCETVFKSFNRSVFQHGRPDYLDDFFPDFPDESDEQSYSKILKSPLTVQQNICPEGRLSCLIGHPSCYPIAKMCLYDKDEAGHLKFCRNGLHLRSCDLFDCSASFKCRSSYCIPAHRVCDSVIDCPYADDEAQCPILTCHSMLRCSSGRCVHPDQICDGVSQCENGEDEEVCDAPSCPELCNCLGHSVSCTQSNLTEVPLSPHTAKILILKDNSITLTMQAFDHYHQLMFLDLSNNALQSIELRRSPCVLERLIQLDFSHNMLLHLSDGVFSCLQSLLVLHISWNPWLTFISINAFSGLNKLQQLSLEYTSLVVVSADTFSVFEHMSILNISNTGISRIEQHACTQHPSIQTIDIRNNWLKVIDIGAMECFQNVSHILSEQDGLCCLRHVADKCLHSQKYQYTCFRLLFWKGVYLFVCCISVVSAVGNLVVLVFAFSKRTHEELLLNSNLAVSNLLCLQPMALAAFWDEMYGQEMLFYQSGLARNAQCKIASFFMIVSMEVSNCFLVTLAMSKCIAVLHKVATKAKTSSKTVFIISTVWAVWTLLAIIETSMLSRTNVHDCFVGLGYTPWYTNIKPVCFTVNCACCILVTVFHSKIARLFQQASDRGIGSKQDSRAKIYQTVITRSQSTIALMILSTMPANMFMVVDTFYEIGHVRSAVFIIMYQLQAVTSPFLYTFSTRRFRAYVAHLFTNIGKQ